MQRPCCRGGQRQQHGGTREKYKSSPAHLLLVKATFKAVELGGLEPLTFSLRRHRVQLIRREHGVIDMQVAAAGAP